MYKIYNSRILVLSFEYAYTQICVNYWHHTQHHDYMHISVSNYHAISSLALTLSQSCRTRVCLVSWLGNGRFRGERHADSLKCIVSWAWKYTIVILNYIILQRRTLFLVYYQSEYFINLCSRLVLYIYIYKGRNNYWWYMDGRQSYYYLAATHISLLTYVPSVQKWHTLSPMIQVLWGLLYDNVELLGHSVAVIIHEV